MPNHVAHKITLEGTIEHVEQVLNTVKGEFNDGTENPFDFNKIMPMPKELRNVTSPVRIVSVEERKTQEKELEKFLAGDRKGFQPTLGLTQELQQTYLKKFGADNWYDWAIKNWGTKWGAYQVSRNENVLTFETAWSHPYRVISHLSNLFPDVTFHVQYADEDIGNNIGDYTIKTGEKLEDNTPDEGTDDAIKLACEVHGYNYNDYLKELE